ncbi:MAG: TolC family protein [Gemmatimonadetes bacterium]|nr:TolC family protein [Gemmatimonadota bacterium]NNM04187.1 TolC family protein [Gemmatimonadota bacterium]
MSTSFRVMAVTALTVLSFQSPAAGQTPSTVESYNLDDLIRLARERNPDLLALRAGRASADAGRRDSGRFQNPELEFVTGEGDPFEGGENKTLREFSVSQTIRNPISRHYRQGALKTLVEAADEGVNFGTLDVDSEVRLHFYRVLFLEERLRLARLNEEALEEVRGLIETRARVGEVKELEAIRLRVEHMRSENEVSEAILELSQHRQHLNTFLGNTLPGDYSLVGELLSDLVVPAVDQLKESLLPRHPLVAQAARQREAARQNLKATQFQWIPDPVVSATSAKELDGDIFKWGFGLQVPLWNQSRAATERERQTLRQTEYQEQGLLLELEAELTLHHNHLLLGRQTLQLFQGGLLEEAEMSMEIAETSYREGEISLVEYLDARRTFQSIQLEYQEALYDWNRELAELNRAVGGGIL